MGLKKQPAARVHPDDRAQIEASNTVAAVYHGVPQRPAQISYYSPILIQCTLPHSDPKASAWKKVSGPYTLIVNSGLDKDLQPYGVPYGSLPRLVLGYIQTQIIKTGECKISFDAHFRGFLKEIGYTANFNRRHAKSIVNQLNRLVRASFSWDCSDSRHMEGGSAAVSYKFELWFDEENPDQISIFDSYIIVTTEFRDAVLRSPVPMRTDILKALRKSPLALDVYMWVSYRLFTMKASGDEELSLSYAMLQQQFGTGTAEENYRKFRQQLKRAFAQVAQYWQEPGSEKQRLNFDLNETRLVLYRSPLLIEKQSSAAEDEARQIMASRSFDMETRKKARQIAAGWDVNWLIGSYFEWVEKRGATPKNPKLHLMQFIRSHIKRNGSAA